MAAHVYWRLGIATGTNYIELKELAFLNSEMQDLSTGGTASASSESSPSYSAAKAFDKNLGTAWIITNGAFPAWIQYQHPTPVDVAFVRLTASDSYSWSGPSLSYSDDGVTWSTPLLLSLALGGPINSSTESILVPSAVFSGLAYPLARARPLHSAAVPTVAVAGVPRTRLLIDVEHGGRGSIPGTVKRDADPTDLPLRRRVRLHREADGMLVRETWSDATTGDYLFTDINPALKYTVISYDHEHNYRAVVADNITPEVLP